MPRDVTDAQISAIPGWLDRVDRALFRFVLAEQVRRGQTGDLAELGVYLGASASLIGSYQQPGETFTVVDLFGDSPDDAANGAENRRWYPDLSQDAFEENYRRVHGELPVVIRGPSSSIGAHAARGRHRFVHVDASHEYDHVVADIATSRSLLAPDGVVVFDDFRSEHTPAVAAAVWGAAASGLIPLALSGQKLYGTWGEAATWRQALADWLAGTGFPSHVHRIAGHDVTRVWRREGEGIRGWIPPAVVPAALRARHLLRASR
jgi:Methyltransferase domain